MINTVCFILSQNQPSPYFVFHFSLAMTCNISDATATTKLKHQTHSTFLISMTCSFSGWRWSQNLRWAFCKGDVRFDWNNGFLKIFGKNHTLHCTIHNQWFTLIPQNLILIHIQHSSFWWLATFPRMPLVPHFRMKRTKMTVGFQILVSHP